MYPIPSYLGNHIISFHLIKDVVKSPNVVAFEYFRQGKFYYSVYNPNETPNGEVYQFAIPIEEVGDATFNKTEKAIMFMRFIRKSMEANEFVKIR